MRIIAGKYRRINLDALDGDDITRPTKDMVKEALFDSLQISEGDTFLDLFSGTGSIGIEAISRGAIEVVFNDVNSEAIKIINKNLNKIHEKHTVYNLSYDICLNKLKGKQFDYIFLDPPYIFENYEHIFKLIYENNLITKRGIIIVEVRKDIDLNEMIFNFKQYKIKKYGISKLLYYRKCENND